MDNTLNIVGSISNAVAAIAAVVAIGVTIWNFKTDKKEQKQERKAERKGVLYKESVIDFWLKKISADISAINQEMLQLSENKTVTSDVLQELYRRIRTDSQSWLYELEIIKVFNEKLYNEVKDDVEKVVDTYSVIINKSLEKGVIPENFGIKINRKLIVIRKKIYKRYLLLV